MTEPDSTPAQRIHCLRYLADCFCRLDRADEALEQYRRAEQLLSSDDVHDRIAILNDRAFCLGMKNDFDQAESLCRTALDLCSQSKPERSWQLARTEAHLGVLEYLRGKYESAIPYLKKAEQALDRSGRKDMAALVLRQKLAFGEAGSCYHLRRFHDAYKQFDRMYEIDVSLFGKADLQTGWAMLALSDVLEKIKQDKLAEDWYRRAIYVFRKFNGERLCREMSCGRKPPAEIEQRIKRLVFGRSDIPEDLKDARKPLCKDSSALLYTHDPRSLYARPFTDAPGRVWLDPRLTQQGIVIAIHGLSLQHSSYDAFARQLARHGFCTVAFDVRGFGTYRQALGAEQLDFKGCMRDLELVVSAIRAANPGRPLFLLGESMGGAIALQFAARYPQLIDGLIASVPAGKRFKERKTVMKVALHLLENKDRSFDIGTDVINQATHDPELRKEWARDPGTRSRLSARELIAFQKMCNRNLEQARKIKSTPVIIFQGVSDGLVKPDATYRLFRTIACRDKSFVMVGNTEHLIFEEGCFTPAVLKGLVAWMESHIEEANRGRAVSPPASAVEAGSGERSQSTSATEVR